MNQSLPAAQVIQFRYPDKPGRPSDKLRILAMFVAGEITAGQKDIWLERGGHKL